jgi:hypothetical protein
MAAEILAFRYAKEYMMTKRDLLTRLTGKEVQITHHNTADSISISTVVPAASTSQRHIIRSVGDDVFEATNSVGIATYYSIAHVRTIHMPIGIAH